MRFLQKIDVRLYFLILFGLFLFFINVDVKAYENTNSSWNLTIPDYNSQMQNVSCGSNGSMYDVVNDFITNYESNYYDLFIGSPVLNGTSITLYLSQKNSPYDLLLYSGSVSTNQIIMQLFYSTNTFRFPYYTINSETCSNYQTRTDFDYFKTLYETNVNNGGLGYQNYEYNQYSAPVYGNTEQLSSLNNTDSFNTSIWFYYSSKQLEYSYYTNNNYYGKNLCITNNSTCYSMGDNIPSYYDIADIPVDLSFPTYRTSIDTIYTNLDSSNVSSYNLQYKFDLYTDLLSQDILTNLYVDNLEFSTMCFTRKRIKLSGDTTNSYMYNYYNIPCTITYNYSINNSTITYNFSNLTLDTSLLGDKTYITLNSKYIDTSLSYSIHDISYTYTLGDFYNTTNKGNIYETFTNLPTNFNMFISGYGDSVISNVYLYKPLSIYNIKYDSYSISNKSMKSSLIVNNNLFYMYERDFLKFNTTLSNDTGILVYQIGNNNISLPKLNLFFNQQIGISFSDNQEDFYYFVDNNIPAIGTFVPPIPNTNDVEANYNDTNINHYFSKANAFIDSLSSDCLELASLTQQFYDGLPLLFQSFVFVIFILACTYFLYLLIRK